MDLVFFVRHKKGSVECVMDFPRFEETELVSDRGEDLDDREGSFMFWGELGVGNGALEVPGF